MRDLGVLLALALLAAPVLAQTPSGGSQTGGQPGGQPGAMVLDRVVAVVNDEALTLSEIQEEGQPVVRKIFQEYVGPERDRRLEQAQRQLMDDLIDRRLMYQIAKKEGMLPSAAEINSAIDELKRNNNAADDAQFRALLKAEGLTFEMIRRSVGERLAIGRLLTRQIRASIIITEDELVKYYESNQEKFKRTPTAEIRHLLVAIPPDGDEAKARSRVDEALAKIQGGADFVQVVRQYSDPPTGDSGGGAITVHRGELAPEIEAAAFGLRPGGVSQPIRTGAGWHLIKVEQVQAEPVAPFAEARETVRDQVFQEKFEAKRKDWLASQKSRAFIQVLVQAGDLRTEPKKP